MAPVLNLVGAGHVGRTLGRLLAEQGGFRIGQVLTRSHASARQAVDFIGAGQPVERYDQLQPAAVYMLAVADDQIGPAGAALARAVPLAGSIVFHCSGALASGHLQAAREAGALVASVHPIRSFADPAAVAGSFGGTYCGVEGDAGALAVLTPALEAIGALPVAIDAGAKTVYHAAAVFASNYLVTPSAMPEPHTAMEAGMITSIEPGLYRPGQWGIRIENLVLNRAAGQTDFGDFLQFETLTLCPIDTRCLDVALLRDDERRWLNDYHAMVRERLAPLVTGAPLAWLQQRTEAV